MPSGVEFPGCSLSLMSPLCVIKYSCNRVLLVSLGVLICVLDDSCGCVGVPRLTVAREGVGYISNII